jgi:uncharacterized membrane protein
LADADPQPEAEAGTSGEVTPRAGGVERPSIEIPDELVEIVQQVDDPTKLTTILQFAASFWRGPLPPPQVLAEYNKAFPGCAERIFAMAEQQSQHRRTIEADVIESDIRLRDRGQICAMVLATMVIIGGFVAIMFDHSLTGLSAILVALGSLVGLFLYSRHQATRDLRTRRAQVAQAQNGPRYDAARAAAAAAQASEDRPDVQ